MKNNINHIFVDTNVLIGAYIGKEIYKKCLQYLYSLVGKKLFISALSIAQLVSIFQKKKTNKDIKKIVSDLFTKFDVIDFVRKDIENAMLLEYADMEDNIQYEMSSKLKCGNFVTNNTKDYRLFANINVIKPSKIKSINQ